MLQGKFIAGVLLVFVSGAASASMRPVMFRIGYMPEAPTIDGTINEDEWAHASSLTGLVWPIGADAVIYDRQVVVWFGWDAEHLYLAARSYLKPGVERNFVAKVPGDCYEFGIYPLDAAKRFNEAFRIIASTEEHTLPTYARVQHVHERPDIWHVSERLKEWEPEIIMQGRIVADPDNTYGEGTELWEMEMRLRRVDFDIEPANKPEHVWSWLVARNFTNPPAQPHLPIRSDFFNAHGFSWGTIACIEEPNVQFRCVLPLLKGKNGANLRFFNPTEEDVTMTMRVLIKKVETVRNQMRATTTLHERTETIVVPAGQAVDSIAQEKLEDLDYKNAYRIELSVRGPENVVYLDYRSNYRLNEALMQLPE